MGQNTEIIGIDAEILKLVQQLDEPGADTRKIHERLDALVQIREARLNKMVETSQPAKTEPPPKA